MEHLGRGQHQPKPSILLRDYVTYTTRCSKDITRTQTRSKSSSLSITYPITNYVTSAKFFPKYHAFLAIVTVGDELTIFSVKEIEVIENNVTLNLETLPLDKKEIGCK
ncbi:hypothetical protein CR513_11992, partial [Mucuna pruriens]